MRFIEIYLLFKAHFKVEVEIELETGWEISLKKAFVDQIHENRAWIIYFTQMDLIVNSFRVKNNQRCHKETDFKINLAKIELEASNSNFILSSKANYLAAWTNGSKKMIYIDFESDEKNIYGKEFDSNIRQIDCVYNTDNLLIKTNDSIDYIELGLHLSHIKNLIQSQTINELYIKLTESYLLLYSRNSIKSYNLKDLMNKKLIDKPFKELKSEKDILSNYCVSKDNNYLVYNTKKEGDGELFGENVHFIDLENMEELRLRDKYKWTNAYFLDFISNENGFYMICNNDLYAINFNKQPNNVVYCNEKSTILKTYYQYDGPYLFIKEQLNDNSLETKKLRLKVIDCNTSYQIGSIPLPDNSQFLQIQLGSYFGPANFNGKLYMIQSNSLLISDFNGTTSTSTGFDSINKDVVVELLLLNTNVLLIICKSALFTLNSATDTIIASCKFENNNEIQFIESSVFKNEVLEDHKRKHDPFIIVGCKNEFAISIYKYNVKKSEFEILATTNCIEYSRQDVHIYIDKSFAYHMDELNKDCEIRFAICDNNKAGTAKIKIVEIDNNRSESEKISIVEIEKDEGCSICSFSNNSFIFKQKQVNSNSWNLCVSDIKGSLELNIEASNIIFVDASNGYFLKQFYDTTMKGVINFDLCKLDGGSYKVEAQLQSHCNTANESQYSKSDFKIKGE